MVVNNIKVNIDRVNDGLPISIIIPLSNNRKSFFYDFVHPMIEANNPNEIIIVGGIGSAPRKRNEGFRKSTQPYVFFCDDDIILPKPHLEKLYNNLVSEPKSIGYTYSGYKGIVLNPHTHPMKGNFNIETKQFSSINLKRGNFISTMSLIRRDVFPMFDENLKRFQDWDIYLTMLNDGYVGKAVQNNEFYAYYLDEGITADNNNINDAYRIIMEKHNL